LQFHGEKEPNKREDSTTAAGAAWSAAVGGRVFMKTPIHLKRHEDGIFHLHPLHGAFAVIASFVLAVLIVLMLVPPAR
jgi:hypothetical protein